MQGRSATRFWPLPGSSSGREDVAQPPTPAFGFQGARLETWLAGGAGAIVLTDLALWFVRGTPGSLDWLLYGVAVCALGLAFAVFVAWRLRTARSRAQGSSVAKIGGALPNARRPGVRNARRVVYSPWLFYERLREEIQRSRVYGLTIGIIVVRIDGKAPVDGPLQEAVKSRIASLARQGLRSRDIAGELGSNEFALYLPETDRRGALLVGARLIDLVEDVSPGAIGVAAFPEDGASAEDVVDAARRRAVPYRDSEAAQPA